MNVPALVLVVPPPRTVDPSEAHACFAAWGGRAVADPAYENFDDRADRVVTKLVQFVARRN